MSMHEKGPGGGAASRASTPIFISGKSRKRHGSSGATVTTHTKKWKQLSADEFRQRGKLEESNMEKCIGHWRQFFHMVAQVGVQLFVYS